MVAIIEFKTAIRAAQFRTNICGRISTWDMFTPENNTSKILRVLSMSNSAEDESLYKYLRDMGVFEEVEFE